MNNKLTNAALEKQVCLSNIAQFEARIAGLEQTKAELKNYGHVQGWITEEELNKSIDSDKAAIEGIKKIMAEIDESLM
ncbi:hypothetical protein [Paenibacillus gallinarum]|uniref:Uncharacterized protein n=1 Tax=Paenibacillus gallinarum TaxID=2762232 RepID=A0ABR8SW67_9BACL|nr:hypothetical protein [Paenibacillus gallinarum]MBD7967746.1 hypothetical protein [Paenibacillus gallinarum]